MTPANNKTHLAIDSSTCKLCMKNEDIQSRQIDRDMWKRIFLYVVWKNRSTSRSKFLDEAREHRFPPVGSMWFEASLVTWASCALVPLRAILHLNRSR